STAVHAHAYKSWPIETESLPNAPVADCLEQEARVNYFSLQKYIDPGPLNSARDSPSLPRISPLHSYPG
ncbi:MAG: hypothetical protein ACREXR_21280, partial [Gammaproteobacteria bacterium]